MTPFDVRKPSAQGIKRQHNADPGNQRITGGETISFRRNNDASAVQNLPEPAQRTQIVRADSIEQIVTGDHHHAKGGQGTRPTESSCRPRALARRPAPRPCKSTNNSEMQGGMRARAHLDTTTKNGARRLRRFTVRICCELEKKLPSSSAGMKRRKRRAPLNFRAAAPLVVVSRCALRTTLSAFKLGQFNFF